MEEERGGIPGLEVIYRNGVTIRPPSSYYPDTPPNAEFQNGVATKDCVLDPILNLWVRVFVPQREEEEKENKSSFPVLVYHHGGGFVTLNASSSLFHDLCHQISKKLTAIVVSVNYRLAPENRLPAAYEDAFTALKWIGRIRSGEVEDGWFQAADFTKVFLAGDSAGGNIAHHLAVRAAREQDSLGFSLAGQILIQPFFGGVERSESEVRLANSGTIITTGGCDFFWRMALPKGADRSHEYCDVLATLAEVVKSVPYPRTLVVVGDLDLLHDRGVEYAKIVEEGGKSVKLVSYEAEHGFYGLLEGSPHAKLLLDEIFMFCKD